MQVKVGLLGIMAAIILFGSGQLASAEGTKEFTVVAVVVGGAKFWLPSTVIANAGDQVTLTLRNSAGADHGFAIDELGIKVVVPANGTKVITFSQGSTGVLRYYCHLHKAHVGGQLMFQ